MEAAASPERAAALVAEAGEIRARIEVPVPARARAAHARLLQALRAAGGKSSVGATRFIARIALAGLAKSWELLTNIPKSQGAASQRASVP